MKQENRYILYIVLILVVSIIVYFLVTKRNIILHANDEANGQNTSEISTSQDVQKGTVDNSTNQTQKEEDKINENKELFEDYYAESEKLLETMTLEEKVGQMFYARYPGNGANNEIKANNPGGYILFGVDFKNETKSSILEKIQQNQSNSKIKMFMGVDEEGGTVVRVSRYKAFRNSQFCSPQELWQQGQLERIIEDSTEKSELLKSIGLNTNFAPVVDVPTKETSFIYSRSYGRGADNTAIYTKELIKNMNNDNMISVMKHFPGYGDNVDTHTGVAIDDREYQNFENSDFKPFIEGINVGCPMILVSHNVVNCMDKDFPASLSKNVHDVLRNELNFSGLIITDDLAMDAVKEYVENGNAATQAVLAGNDMIISSDFVNQKREIIKAVENNEIPMEYIDNAVRRILACKLAYGIIEKN